MDYHQFQLQSESATIVAPGDKFIVTAYAWPSLMGGLILALAGEYWQPIEVVLCTQRYTAIKFGSVTPIAFATDQVVDVCLFVRR